MKSLIPILTVSSIEASLAYYSDVLGFSTGFTMPGEDGKLVHASANRGETELMFGRCDPARPDSQDPLGNGVVLYFTVEEDEDIDAYFQRASSAGASVVQDPTDQFWGHRDWGIKDPDGYQLFISKEVRQVDPREMAEAMAGAATG